MIEQSYLTMMPMVMLAQAEPGDRPPSDPGMMRAPSVGGAPAGDGSAGTLQIPISDVPGQTADPNAGMGQLWFFVIFILALWLLLLWPQRREKKKREEMLGKLSKGDRVATVGGFLGTVVEVRETEVVLKVDENKDIRMHFSRNAIQTILSDKSERSEKDKADKAEKDVK